MQNRWALFLPLAVVAGIYLFQSYRNPHKPVSPVQVASAIASGFHDSVETLKSEQENWSLSSQANQALGWSSGSYTVRSAEGERAVTLQDIAQDPSALSFEFDSKDFGYLSEVEGIWSGQGGQRVWDFDDERIHWKRVWELVRPGVLKLSQLIEFKESVRPAYFFVSVQGHSPESDPEEHDRQLVYYQNKEIRRVSVSGSIDTLEIAGPVSWIGASNRYFAEVVLPDAGDTARGMKGLVLQSGPRRGKVSLVYPIRENRFFVAHQIYVGPKDLSQLRAVDPTLDTMVDLGWFTVLAYPILKGMNWLYGFVGNYGVAIILLTLFLKLLTLPLTWKSAKSMRQMAKVQPLIQKAQETYKNDREALNREMLNLMRTKGYNPMAGCLPILVQMPVFFALYRVLYSAVELYQAPFYGWIRDLSMRDPYYIFPVLLTAVMFVQQRITPVVTADPTQQKLMKWMPLMFGGFMLTLPSGLAIYMLVNSIVSVGQQFLINRRLDTIYGPLRPAKA